MDTGHTSAVRARYVFPVVGEPISGGIVTMRDGRIVAVRTHSEVHPVDLGNVAILPGLVNAHTHLEFSQLDKPLGEPGEPLPTWIRRVIAARITDPEVKRGAITSGIEQSRAAGVAVLGEIATSLPEDVAPHQSAPCITHFQEVICLDRQRFQDVLQPIDRLREISTRSSVSPGISPHAPYSVHPELFAELCQLAARHQWPIAMHLAESPEEMELLATGGGPFRELLEELGVWRDDANPQGLQPLHYLRQLAQAPRALVVHGNYLKAEDWAFAAEHRERMGIVYCPRTHAWFGHEPYPLEKMVASGVTICIGTDSLASNPNLNLFEELKFAVAHHPTVSPREILRMGTLNGARLLSGNDHCGTLEPGRSANLTIVKLPDRHMADPYDLLFSGESAVGRWE